MICIVCGSVYEIILVLHLIWWISALHEELMAVHLLRKCPKIIQNLEATIWFCPNLSESNPTFTLYVFFLPSKSVSHQTFCPDIYLFRLSHER
jgi:hypothetical protein